MKIPWLSLIIIMAGPAGRCTALLDSLSHLNGDEVEVLLIDDGTDARALAELQNMAGRTGGYIQVLTQPIRGAGSGRNLGLSRARGEIVFVSQSDCSIPPGLPAKLREAFEPDEVSALGGMVRAANSAEPLARLAFWDEAYGLSAGEIGLAFCPSLLCAAYRRTDLNQAGMFDEELTEPGGVDVDLCARLEARGAETGFNPELYVLRPYAQTWAGLWRSELAKGRERFGLIQRSRAVGWKGAGPGLAENVQPAVMILALGLAVSLWPHSPEKALTWAGICLLLLYPLNRPFLKALSQQEPELMRRALPYCLMRPAAWTLGMLWGALDRIGGK